MKRSVWMFILLGLLSVNSQAAAPAGQVVFSTGEAKAIDESGIQRQLNKGDAVLSGDTLETQNGLLQVKFSDGGFMSFKPHSRFEIQEYRFNGVSDGQERSHFKLMRGGLRTVTGQIGKTNRTAYRINTPSATIGIRGTKFLLDLDNGLTVHMGEDGALEVHDQAGGMRFLSAMEVFAAGGRDVVIDLLRTGGLEALLPVGSALLGSGGRSVPFVSGEQLDASGLPAGATISDGMPPVNNQLPMP